MLGGGRGCVLRVSGTAAAVWIPLRGRLQIDAANADSVAMPGEMRVTEPEPRIHAIGRGNALWMGIFGHPHAWRRALGGLIEMPTPEPVLLPARHRADNALRRRAIALARADEASRGDKALTLIESIAAQQAAFAPAIARCPGRTLAQRRSVFLRLQRVRNYMASSCHLDLDIAALARMASYSPWHFIRAFSRRVRRDAARGTSSSSGSTARAGCSSKSALAITEIARASGFENRCAFSRSFKRALRHHGDAMRRGDARESPTASPSGSDAPRPIARSRPAVALACRCSVLCDFVRRRFRLRAIPATHCCPTIGNVRPSRFFNVPANPVADCRARVLPRQEKNPCDTRCSERRSAVACAPYGVAGSRPDRLPRSALAIPAIAQDAQDQNNQQLETITVTGSNIRRVDIETSNPVITIDRAAIQKTGKLTLGDLVQQLPAVTGPNINPQVNNGGGTGVSSIGLRGLGSPRTLVLINGHRLPLGRSERDSGRT